MGGRGLDHQGQGWAVPRTETAGPLGSFGSTCSSKLSHLHLETNTVLWRRGGGGGLEKLGRFQDTQQVGQGLVQLLESPESDGGGSVLKNKHVPGNMAHALPRTRLEWVV